MLKYTRVINNLIAVLALANFIFASAASADELLTAVAAEHKMLQYMEDGEVKGPSAEIFKLLMKESGLNAEIDFYPWSRAYQTAISDDNTLVLSIVRTKEREDKFHWLIKVSELVRGFVSLQAHPENQINYIKDVKNKSVAVLRDSYSYHSLIALGFSDVSNIYEVATLEHGIELFLSGKVDLIYTDPNVLVNYLTSKKQPAETLINVHILPQTRRDSYIAGNINLPSATLKKLKKAAFTLQSNADYQYYLQYKPLID